jgi:MFS family permease
MWAILGLVLLADALDVIDATVTNIAAPTIARELNGGESLIKWLGPAYMLAMGVLLAVGGRPGARSLQRRPGPGRFPHQRRRVRPVLAPIFLINIILGVTGLVMAARILPLYGLIEGSTNGWGVIPGSRSPSASCPSLPSPTVSAPPPTRSSSPRS